MEQGTLRHIWNELDGLVPVLAPAADGHTLSEFLETSLDRIREPFSDARCEIVGALSSAFLKDPLLRDDPAGVAVGFWMRRSNVSRLKALYERKLAEEPSVVRVPVGRVFHVAPSNVDTMFIYSWVLSYLCGNSNVVRLSQERDPSVEAMLRAISVLAATKPELRDTNRFVTYEHDEKITAAFSTWCSHRIIWGGDETIGALRPVALNPHASERLFGSKFSYAVVSAARYLAAEDGERRRLAGGFFNDLFWFDQMACSSPHIVFWVGAENRCEKAVSEFEARLQEEVKRRAYVPEASNAMRRLVYAFDLAADADVRVHLEHPGFIGVRVRDIRWLDKQTCGGGLIRHACLGRLEELEPFATEADQTVTHFGFEQHELTALAARIGARGVDRIVPVGEALSFNVIWDGFDLLEDLMRKVTVQAESQGAIAPP